MNIIELLLISISLAMDAFTISICEGVKNNNLKIGLITSSFFALFQAIMPIIGYYLGYFFNQRIINYHNYFSSILLIIVGIIMIKDDRVNIDNKKLNYHELILLSLATSIDAFVVGISISFNQINIFISSIIIGIITFIITIIGFSLGNKIHKKIHQYANIIGGIILIIIGIKYLFN